MPNIVAIVPMRHHSERVPGKNYRDFAGRPLYHHIVEALLGSGAVGTVVIDTDSPRIMDDCGTTFPEVVLMERPAHLRAGDTPMNEVLLHTVSHVDADFYLQTHSTNPLLRPESIASAVSAFIDRLPEVDSLFSVTRLQTRLWDSLTRPINHNPAFLLRTQDLPPIYEENSCLYLFTGELLSQRRNRIGERPLMWELSADEAVDIDEETDFRVAELLMKERMSAS
jgi:CMP-N-acetylneuraminic acid synthetase